MTRSALFPPMGRDAALRALMSRHRHALAHQRPALSWRDVAAALGCAAGFALVAAAGGACLGYALGILMGAS